MKLRTEFRLEDWQRHAVDAWLQWRGPRGRRCGIFDVYTGAGKTILALGAMERVALEDPAMKFAVVVPTIQLARQWKSDIAERTDLPGHEVGVVGGGHDGSFAAHRVLVFVIDSARALVGGRSRLARSVDGHRVTLVVDECHKAGAPARAKIFDARVEYRLGLSATPERGGADAFDEDGQEIPLDSQLHVQGLGPVCYRRTLKDGRRAGALPRYEVHHHGIDLSPKERATYDGYTRKIRDAEQDLQRAGGGNYLSILKARANRSAKLVNAARALQEAMLVRKHFLYSVGERLRVAKRLVVSAWHEPSAWSAAEKPAGAILFNERISDDRDQELADDAAVAGEGTQRSGAASLHAALRELARSGALDVAEEAIALEHSGLRDDERDAAVDGLRRGSVQILCTVKALQEGINVPDVGMGLSVASTSSARQRIQTMGRILRPKRDAQGRRVPPENAPVKTLHLLYVKGTSDESIYRQHDWSEETGEDRERWWHWKLGEDAPSEDDPLRPTAVDEQTAWERIAAEGLPRVWDGPTRGLKLTHARGTVTPSLDPRSPVHNATELIALLEGAERRGVIADARGGFTVMNATRVVLKRGPSDTNPNEQVCWALGRLDESPQWKDVDASNIEAREDGARVASGPIAARDASRKEREREQEDVRSALAELQEDARAFEARPNAGDYWYVLLQHAFLGAAQGDAAVAKAAAELLSTRGTRPMVEAAKKAARILAGLERATSPTAPPLGVRQMELPDLIPHVASAFVDERPDLVRDALREFRTTTAARPRRIAIMRCMQILTGEKRSVYLGEREAQGSG